MVVGAKCYPLYGGGVKSGEPIGSAALRSGVAQRSRGIERSVFPNPRFPHPRVLSTF